MDEPLTIQACAKRTKLTPSALRYYERTGLLPPITRDHNGHRQYSADDIVWIDFVTCMRKTGMPLKAIREFGALHFTQGSLRQRLEILEQHHAHMAAQHAALEEAMAFIGKKIERFKVGVALRENHHAET